MLISPDLPSILVVLFLLEIPVFISTLYKLLTIGLVC